MMTPIDFIMRYPRASAWLMATSYGALWFWSRDHVHLTWWYL